MPVARFVPAAIMGSGLGRATVARGDYDIQCFDPVMVKEYGLDELRYGDIVAIVDADHSYGRIYRTGAVSIGIVAHGSSDIAGHGPGRHLAADLTERRARARTRRRRQHRDACSSP